MLEVEFNQSYWNFFFPYLKWQLQDGFSAIYQCYDTKKIKKHFSEYPEITSPSSNSWADNTGSQSLTAEQ